MWFGSGELKVERENPVRLPSIFFRIYFSIIKVKKVHIIGASERKIVIDKKRSPKFNVRLAGCVNFLSVKLSIVCRKHERAGILGIHGLTQYKSNPGCIVSFIYKNSDFFDIKICTCQYHVQILIIMNLNFC